MRTRLGKWMILGTLALALAGFYGLKAGKTCVQEDICKDKETNRQEKIIKTGLPILEAVTRRMIRM